MSGFVKYFHLERMYKDETKGINNGTIFIQAKLDGSNGQIYWRNGLKAGSRNRELGLGDADNQGFYAWVLENASVYEPFFTMFPSAVLYGEWLCLSGDTIIRKTSAGKNSSYMTLREMYKYSVESTPELQRYTTKEGEKTFISNRESWWRRNGFPSIFSLHHNEDKIKPNKIKDIFFTGVKEVFEIKTRKGLTIKASKNHPFFTPNGYVALEDLKVNDCVAVTGFLTNRKKRTYGRGTNKIQNAQAQYKLDVAKCENCGNTRTLELHHKDGNHSNNEIDNFLCLCRDCHIEQHRLDKKFIGAVYDYEFDKIISISYVGEEDCYDISMEGDESTANFVANGFIVHNCPHTLKCYLPDAWNKFYVFDMAFDKGEHLEFLTPEQYQPVLDVYGITYVPTVAKIENYEGSYEEFRDKVNYLIDPSIKGASPEGLVIKNYGFINQYGRNCFAKIVFEQFHEEKKAKVALESSLEVEIAEKYVTEHLVQKELAKLKAAKVEKLQPALLKTVFYVLLAEELADIVKKYKLPIIDFKALNRAVIVQVKKYASEVF